VDNKYKDIHKKTAKEAALIAAKVEKSNYLAHTIREIEYAISIMLSKNYRIHIHIPQEAKTSANVFRERCCEIQLEPVNEDTVYTNEVKKDRRIRLTLAHELGHLIYNFDKLKDHEALNKRKCTPEEEIYAWMFAYHLIEEKSNHHKIDIERKKHIYDDGELKQSLVSILENPNSKIDIVVIQGVKECLRECK